MASNKQSTSDTGDTSSGSKHKEGAKKQHSDGKNQLRTDTDITTTTAKDKTTNRHTNDTNNNNSNNKRNNGKAKGDTSENKKARKTGTTGNERTEIAHQGWTVVRNNYKKVKGDSVNRRTCSRGPASLQMDVTPDRQNWAIGSYTYKTRVTL